MKKFTTLVTIFSLCLAILFPALTLAAPADKQTAEIEPFQWGEINIEFDPTLQGGSTSFIVPVDKRLVIEYVSASIFKDGDGDIAMFDVKTTVNDATVSHFIPPTPLGAAGGYAKSYAANQSLRIYADPGTTVILTVGNPLSSRAGMHVSVSGYLESVD